MLRSVFVFTSIMIAFNQAPDWLFCSDWFRLINMALFAFTNGHASTLCMCFGPERVDDEDKELAGFVMGFSLCGGIFFGALLATFGMGKIDFS